MSRFVLVNCIDVMARIPGNAIYFILTAPPSLSGFRDRPGRTLAGSKTDQWFQRTVIWINDVPKKHH
ncbi:hypothetical protein J4U37_20810 [Escherichia coli]